MSNNYRGMIAALNENRKAVTSNTDALEENTEALDRNTTAIEYADRTPEAIALKMLLREVQESPENFSTVSQDTMDTYLSMVDGIAGGEETLKHPEAVAALINETLKGQANVTAKALIEAEKTMLKGYAQTVVSELQGTRDAGEFNEIQASMINDYFPEGANVINGAHTPALQEYWGLNANDHQAFVEGLAMGYADEYIADMREVTQSFDTQSIPSHHWGLFEHGIRLDISPNLHGAIGVLREHYAEGQGLSKADADSAAIKQLGISSHELTKLDVIQKIAAVNDGIAVVGRDPLQQDVHKHHVMAYKDTIKNIVTKLYLDDYNSDDQDAYCEDPNNIESVHDVQAAHIGRALRAISNLETDLASKGISTENLAEMGLEQEMLNTIIAQKEVLTGYVEQRAARSGFQKIWDDTIGQPEVPEDVQHACEGTKPESDPVAAPAVKQPGV